MLPALHLCWVVLLVLFQQLSGLIWSSALFSGMVLCFTFSTSSIQRLYHTHVLCWLVLCPLGSVTDIVCWFWSKVTMLQDFFLCIVIFSGSYVFIDSLVFKRLYLHYQQYIMVTQ
ncbi:hypothetical protein P9112_004439 [Eukaryota sp. TZLM1-RC]